MATADLEAYRHPDSIADESTPVLISHKRCCFCFPFSGHRRSPNAGVSFWKRIKLPENENRWWSKDATAIRKLREWSEIVAGPKWKTFIRRFNRKRSGGGGTGRHGKFQYDPLSYALNFDEGPKSGSFGEDDDDFGGSRYISTRYAPVALDGSDSDMGTGK